MAVLGAGSSIGGLAGSGAVSRLLVVISGETSGLTKALSGATASVSSFNQNASKMGGALTRSLTLPLLALGGVALKLASDYDSAIGRVAGLTTVLDNGKHSIDEVSNSLLALSQKVPTAPTELANAFYFAGSAGLDFSDSMKVVELSAKGAAIGMGDAADISKILIFALNNFKSTGLTAAHAMDVLTAAIKLGTAEPNEMAIALGRLLPIAKQAGLSFDDVAASVASLTNLGVPTRVATTSLRALFSELLSPTIAATTKLNELGISATQLRDTLKLGPVAAFQLLYKATNGNIDALHDIVPQIRGFTALLGLSGSQLKKYRATIDGVRNSTGDLNKAFKIIGKTPAFQFQIALNKLRVAGIKMGNTLVPVFEKIMTVVGDFGDMLANMPAGFRGVTVAAGLLAAALGPLLKLYGNLINNGTGMFTSFKSGAIAITTMAIAAGVAVGGFSSLAKGTGDLMSVLATVVGTALAVGIAFKGIQVAADAGLLGVSSLSVGLASMPVAIIAAAALAIGGLVAVIGATIGASHHMANAAEQVRQSFDQAAQSGDTLAKALSAIKDSGAQDTLTKVATALGLLNKPVGVALPKLIHGVATQASAAEAAISQIDISKVASPEDVAVLTSLQRALSLSATKAVPFNDALKKVGLSADQVNSVIQKLSDTMSVANLGVVGRASGDQFKQVSDGSAESARNLQDLIISLEGGSAAYKDFQTQTKAAILASSLNDAATQELAKHFGVSVDVIKGSLSDLQVSATSVLGSGKGAIKAFGKEAFGALGKTAARAKVAKDAIAALNTTLHDSLAGNLGLFDKFDKKIKQSTASMVTHAQKAATLSLQEAEQAQSLAARGVPGDLVNQLVGAGPQMVAKFAGATDKQLSKLVTAYQIRLGAIDAEIIKEGDHQKDKGKDMVSGFVTAILSSKGLTLKAGHEIVNSVAQGLTSSKIKPKALGMVLTFVRTVEGSGLPEKAASALAAKVVHGIATGKAGTAGLRFVQLFSSAIRSSQLPKQAITHIVQSSIKQLAQSGGALPAGKKHIQQFAQGIVANKGLAKSDTAQVVQAVKTALQKAQQPAQDQGKKTGAKFGSGIGSEQAIVRAWGAKLAAASTNKMASAQGTAYATGAGVGLSFAQGLLSQAGAVAAAAATLAQTANNSLHQNSKGSPKYFTYYLGSDIGQQYHEGMQKGLADSKFDVSQRGRKFVMGGGVHHQVDVRMVEGTLKVRGGVAVLENIVSEVMGQYMDYREGHSR